MEQPACKGNPPAVQATRATLLIKIRNPSDSQAWSEFVSIYAPLLYGYALKAGLQDSDAADLAQDALQQVVRHIQKFDYQPERGSFRGWLLTIARNFIRKQFKRDHLQPRGSGDTLQMQLLGEYASPEEASQWELEYRKRLFELAVDRVKHEFRPTTWQAFWRTAVEGADGLTVGQELQLSVGAVYIARSRVLGRLRQEVAKLDES